MFVSITGATQCERLTRIFLHFRPILTLLILLPLPRAARADDSSLDRFAVVEVAPVKTTIYVASVTLLVPRFVRHGDVYESTYAANIFPYFFWNEQGRLEISVTDDTLRQFARGKPFSFMGHAIRSDGTVRRVEGHVTPGDAANGKIEVRVFVTRHISLAFDTTYHLPIAVRQNPKAP
jgi:hypothetical protein